jgi:hypothetical protein
LTSGIIRTMTQQSCSTKKSRGPIGKEFQQFQSR